MAKTKQNLLKSTLTEIGFSQAELARAAGLSERTINKACNNIQVNARSKRKIRDGLNKLVGEDKYQVEDIFPFG